MAKNAYCPMCGDAVDFTTVRRVRVTDYGGRRYKYQTRQAICSQCGSDATYPPYQEESGRAFNECLRKGAGLVSLATIREIPKRYDIGKRPLSRILGLGEHTYTQLMEGQVPTPEHSKLIQGIFEDPLYYQSLLEARKDEIAASSYERSSAAARAYVERSQPNAYRIYELGRMFVYLAHGDITAMAIQKLTYYYQGFSKPILGNQAFSQMPRAWAAGPVYGQLWHEHKEDPRGYFSYREDDKYSSPFTPAEDELILSVYQHFGCYSGAILSRMTHAEAPWIEARKRAGARNGDHCEAPIAEKDMEDYFEHVVRTYDIHEARDVGRYARAKFREVLRSA